MYLSEIFELTKGSEDSLIKNSVSKPWTGGGYKAGKVGGIWNDTILSDPKTFNQLIAERDAASNGIISLTLDYLISYDASLKQWEPRLAFFEIETDIKNDTLTVHYTLRDELFWTYFNSAEKIPVTSDDFVFWYNEIAGDENFASSGYSSQFVKMKDGSEKRIECIKIDDKHFDFVFPRIVADPLLATNMSLCPSFVYKKAKLEGGAEAVKNLFGINSNPLKLPSCGQWYICEYVPGQRLVCLRNPNYWNKDENSVSIPYPEKRIYQIVGDMNTDFLLFKQGKTEVFTPRPEEISGIIEGQKDGYTVFNAEGSMSAPLWSFNQNPKNSNELYYEWFSKKQFRQAMSCLLNRDRIISQVYRGFGEAKYTFFAESNPFFDANINLQYRYDPDRAKILLDSIGFYQDENFIMKDAAGNSVVYDLMIPSSSTTLNDIALIISDECNKIGIKVNVKQIDFQKMVEMLTRTYDWQSIIIGLGSNMFPSQGSNVWPSNGNLHLWYPLQKSPATDWEAKIDYLYNEGCFTNDFNSAKKIWEEYQRIILEQCPIIYLIRSGSFFAIRNKWDLTNVYFDNKNGALTEHIYLRSN